MQFVLGMLAGGGMLALVLILVSVFALPKAPTDIPLEMQRLAAQGSTLVNWALCALPTMLEKLQNDPATRDWATGNMNSSDGSQWCIITASTFWMLRLKPDDSCPPHMDEDTWWLLRRAALVLGERMKDGSYYLEINSDGKLRWITPVRRL